MSKLIRGEAVLKERLIVTILGFVGLIAVSAVAQNVRGNQKCPLCNCVPSSARPRCAVSSPAWYENGHFDPVKRTEKLSKQLKLTADQQSQMLNTLESAKSQLETARSDRSLSRRVRKCKLAMIRQASNDQIRAFLDNKQNAKLVRIENSYAYHVETPANWW